MQDQPYDFAADMYSYGCLLVELMCGKAPGEGDFLRRTRENTFDVSVSDCRK